MKAKTTDGNHFSFRPKEEKVQVADVSLSEANLLSEWYPLSETYNSLSGLGNLRR